MDKIKLIAFYLPQYHEIEFNNKYWGKGYTEWTATAKAKPLFKGHYQPHIPADLGFYNLLMSDTREAQAAMAKEYGIDGFCYWHYWFGNGKTIMEQPFLEVLKSKKPDFPFCLSWANHNWHNPKTKEIILKQEYFGKDDYINHFNYLLPAFLDERYIKVNNKPIFSIFAPPFIPDLNDFIDLWNELAIKAGFKGIYFIGIGQTIGRVQDYKNYKLDAINTLRLDHFKYHQNGIKQRIHNFLNRNNIFTYKEAARHFIAEEDIEENIIPTIITGWDHSPRSGEKALILTEYTPYHFRDHIKEVFNMISRKKNKYCFVKSWNEWAEGNHLEPDLKYGLEFLKVLKEEKQKIL